MSNYTHIDDILAPVWQCNDCGAYADTIENIEHFSSCKPGESKEWEKIYEEEIGEEEFNRILDEVYEPFYREDM